MSSNDTFPWKEALIPASINTVINGFISWNSFSGKETIALTVDSISDGSSTAFGGAVITATCLGLILSLINFSAARKQDGTTTISRRESWRVAIGMGLKNAFFLFGLLACSALIWQKLFGTILVAPITATITTALIAGSVSAYLFGDIRKRHRDFVASR